MVVYYKQTAKLHYGLTQKEALKLAFQYGKENGVVTPENWVK
jgi:C-terminal domain of 1-Cys peroxiredoxin.